MIKTKENFLAVDEFYKEIISKFAIPKAKFLRDCNLTEEQYKKLMSSENGKEILKKKLSESSELKSNFTKLQITLKFIDIIERAYTDFLPF